MFIARKIYDDLRDERVKLQVEAAALAQVNAQLNAHIEWMRVRLTQLEFERAQLLKKYMGVDVPAPSFEPASETQAGTELNQTLGFGDMGDAAAAALGIGWNPDGTLNYGDKKPV